MPLKLFGYEPKRISLDAIGTSNRYRHFFGGTAKDYGIRFKNAKHPLHIIYWLNTSDPLVPISIDGISHVPLLFPFAYGTSCGYSIESNNEVTFYAHNDNPCPPWDAPRCFPANSTSFALEPYNPRDPVDALNYKGVFGWEELTDADRDSAVRIAVEEYRISPDEGPDENWDLDDIVSAMYDPPFRQLARPILVCDNPKCKSDTDMEIIAIQQDCIEAEEIWGNMRGQTIWAICPECKSFGVAQQ